MRPLEQAPTAAVVCDPTILVIQRFTDSVVSFRLLYTEYAQPIALMGDTGLEPVTPSLSSWCSSQLS